MKNKKWAKDGAQSYFPDALLASLSPSVGTGYPFLLPGFWRPTCLPDVAPFHQLSALRDGSAYISAWAPSLAHK